LNTNNTDIQCAAHFEQKFTPMGSPIGQIKTLRVRRRKIMMKLTAKVYGENQQLVDTLTEQDITAKLVKGGVVVNLPLQREASGVYEIPKEINDAKLFIDVVEEGGGMTNTGSGTVVCGLEGEALHPYYVPRGGSLSCGTHAHFSVPKAVVTVTGYRHSDDVTIVKYWIVHDGTVARIESKKLWEGDLGILPELFSKFQDAAEAARDKGNCYHCRCVHFVKK